MPDLVWIGAALTASIVASFVVASVTNRWRRQPDPVQALLQRNPIFGNDFYQDYYPDLPRSIVFDIRSEFAELTGVPTDFVLPCDQLATLGPVGSKEAMEEYIVSLLPADVVGERKMKDSSSTPADSAEGTLDCYIRTAAARFSRRSSAAESNRLGPTSWSCVDR